MKKFLSLSSAIAVIAIATPLNSQQYPSCPSGHIDAIHRTLSNLNNTPNLVGFQDRSCTSLKILENETLYTEFFVHSSDKSVNHDFSVS